ncbi:hypothetical protein LY78DRAFT_393023 [Colletotrichum sublineola]|nr:hypothetical protein LY78DRAFT_393023 [Colletotrichum sublineola]
MMPCCFCGRAVRDWLLIHMSRECFFFILFGIFQVLKHVSTSYRLVWALFSHLSVCLAAITADTRHLHNCGRLGAHPFFTYYNIAVDGPGQEAMWDGQATVHRHGNYAVLRVPKVRTGHYAKRHYIQRAW